MPLYGRQRRKRRDQRRLWGRVVQSVPEKTRLEKLFETQIEIFDVQGSYLFSNKPFEKRPGMAIEDFGLHSDDHFESHLLRNGLYSET